MVSTAGATAGSGKPVNNSRSVHCRKYSLSARRLVEILIDRLAHGERSSMWSVEIEFE